MFKNSVTVSTIVCSAFLYGCAPEIPKCSDQQTLSLVRKILVGQVGDKYKALTDTELESKLIIEMPSATGIDEKIKKISCDAALRIPRDAQDAGFKMNISYESQLDDKNDHLVRVMGMRNVDLIGLAYALEASIAASKPPAPQNIQAPAPVAKFDIQPQLILGDYQSDTTSLSVKPGKLAGQFEAITSVGMQGCGGEVQGVGVLDGNVLRFSPPKDADSPLCVISVTFSPEAQSASIEEQDCSGFHGVACGWEGQEVQKTKLPH